MSSIAEHMFVSAVQLHRTHVYIYDGPVLSFSFFTVGWLWNTRNTCLTLNQTLTKVVSMKAVSIAPILIVPYQ
jgi:hypothetical protein